MEQSLQEKYLSLLQASFTAYNKAFFSFKLRPLMIRFSSPSSTRDYGEYKDGEIIIRASLVTGTHPQTQSGFEYESGRILFVKDVLLHQMAHQYCVERLEWPEEHYSGHGPEYSDLCNRIGENLDLPAVRSSKCHAKARHLTSCAVWPWAVRPTGYYGGAFTPKVMKRRTVVDGLIERLLRLTLDEKRELRMILADKKLL